ncbi:hypothetical protein EYR36_000437 [Pleurotus pulmonarius]|nr:hypothetical protein EYR36_000437 [Pleurotus pulmonarius]
MHTLSSETMTVALQWLAITAIYFEYGQAFRSGLVDDLKDTYCTAPTPLIFDGRLSTGYPPVDDQICALMAFFRHATTDQECLTTLVYVLGNLAIPAIFLLIEPCRRPGITGILKQQQPPAISFQRFLAYPTILGLMYQAVSMGPTMSVYWMLFIQSTRTQERPLYVSRADAEGIITAIMGGMFLPTFAMIISAQPIFTWLWQIFPVLVWGIHRGYVRIALRFCSANTQGAGNILIHDFFVFVFLMCWVLHAVVVYPIVMDVDALKAIIIPSVANLPPTASMGRRIADFLKWDGAIGMLSTILGSLWFTTTRQETLGMLEWYIAAVPLVGPGSAVAGVLIWREKQLS